MLIAFANGLHCDAIFGRIARFHAWAELAFCRVPPSQGFSAAQNRDQLCNALISLLHAPPPPPPAAKGAAAAAAAARGECWGYLLLLPDQTDNIIIKPIINCGKSDGCIPRFKIGGTRSN